MEIEKEIRERAARIDEILISSLPKEEGFARTVLSAMNYSVTAGGKRLRPMLMEAAFALYGGQGDCVRPFMAAIECIHTYSLVHDDLPAMDNDEYRRGRKTTHAVYGEAMGILAGDALLNYAYELIAEAMAGAEAAELPKLARAFHVLAECAGCRGMVGGQAVDVESGERLLGEPKSGEMLGYIYEKKTGALIEASLMAGAILAGADGAAVECMRRTGSLLGEAFQIRDDMLDVAGKPEVLGKPVGSDEKNHKATYVALYGMERAGQQVERCSAEAIRILEGVQGDSRFLRELFAYLIDREK